jgi:hypothetical protein
VPKDCQRDLQNATKYFISALDSRYFSRALSLIEAISACFKQVSKEKNVPFSLNIRSEKHICMMANWQ